MVTADHKAILSSGRFSGTTRADLASALARFRASPQADRLVIHFHGGLVDQASAEATAARLLPVYRDQGDAYPLFVIWQAGIWETLRNNWDEILKEEIFPLLVERVLQFVLGKIEQSEGEKGGAVALPDRFEVKKTIDTVTARGEEPYAVRDAEAVDLDRDLPEHERAQFAKLLEDDPRLVKAAQELTRADAPRLARSLERARTPAPPGEKGLVSTAMLVVAGTRVLARCLKRFAMGRGHGIYTTVVEEVARELRGDLVGGIVWRTMKKDTADAFAGDSATHGGTALLEELALLRAEGRTPRLILVGHSTGAVYICHLLQEAAARLPAEVRFEVILLAPACSFELLDETLLVAGDRISAFRAFGMQDTNEKADRLLPPVYLRSLLYFVSGLVERSVDEPLVGMARYHSGERPFTPGRFKRIARVRQRLGAFPDPWVWSIADDGAGLASASVRHVDFDDDAVTLGSVTHLVRHGF